MEILFTLQIVREQGNQTIKGYLKQPLEVTLNYPP